MKKIFLLVIFVAFSANAQFTPSTNVNYIKFLKVPPAAAAADSLSMYAADGFLKLMPSSFFTLDRILNNGNTSHLPIQAGAFLPYDTASSGFVWSMQSNDVLRFVHPENSVEVEFDNLTGAIGMFNYHGGHFGFGYEGDNDISVLVGNDVDGGIYGLPLSVNGAFPDTHGNITIDAGGVQTVTGNPPLSIDASDPLNLVANFDGSAYFTYTSATSDVDANNVAFTNIHTLDVNGAITAASFNRVLLSGASSPILVVTGSAAISNTNTGDNATNTASNTYADGKVENSLIASTTIAPSATAVNTALALKENLSNKQGTLAIDGTNTKYPTVDAINAANFGTGTVGTVVLNTPNVIFTTPVTFTTSSGTATGSLALKTETANSFFAGPTTGTATPTFRAIVSGDVPALNQDTTGGSAKWTTGRIISITGDLTYTSPSVDGTSNVTAAGTLATVNSNVGSFGTATQVPSVTVDGKGRVTAASNISIQITESAVTNLTTDLGNKQNTLSNSAGLAAALSDESGTGLSVFNNSPTFITPMLGTPSSVTLTNGTGLSESGVTNLVSDLAGKEPSIASGTSAQVWTGLKVFTSSSAITNAAVLNTIVPVNTVITGGDTVLVFANKTQGQINRLNAYVAKTGTYTATWNDNFIDCTSGTFTVTLPTAVGFAGQPFTIKNSGTGTITIATTSSQTIDGSTSKTINVQYSAITIKSDGANFKITGTL